MRDDKSYPYIKLTTKDEYPRLAFARQVEDDGAEYFGPFRGGSVRTLLKVLSRLFGIRKCKYGVLKRREQPCLNFHMKRCSAPCTRRITKQQ